MLDRQNSVISILSSGSDLCRICHCDSSCGELISPCYCSGSLRWVHQICLQHWIRASNSKSCELCRYPFSMRSKIRSICEWEALPMSASEKRRFFCSAIFHIVALGCVIWSLSVLIERTVDEVHHSELEWQFWTKIVVEAIGSMGLAILIWVWGKIYISLVSKWIAFNRTFVIVNSDPAPLKTKPSSCTNLNVKTSNSSPSMCRVATSDCCTDTAGSDSGGGEKNSLNSLNREAKALLLPPVVYAPPEAQLESV